MPQYPTPQFIEEEGRIVFFLTFRQFFILVGGGFICVVLYYLLPFLFFLLCAIPVGLLTLAIAFVKIQNESIVTIVFHALGFSLGRKNYLWQKKELFDASNIQQGTSSSKIEMRKKVIETKK